MRDLRSTFSRFKKSKIVVQLSNGAASTAISGRYQYEPITAPAMTRFLVLEAGAEQDDLVGSLRLIDLDHVDGEFSYETISYVWGDATRVGSMVIDGKVHRLTASIEAALRRIRKPDHSRVVWADQISIDQENLEERSQQVKLMHRIYKDSNDVLVWLGPDEKQIAKVAFGAVEELVSYYMLEKSDLPRLMAWEEEAMKSPKGEVGRSLAKLYGLPWFTRLWIVQEIGTKHEATLFWGSETISWQSLGKAAEVLRSHVATLRHTYRIAPTKIRYLFSRFIADSSMKEWFAYELYRASHLVASDNRDRVFAFLGHPSAQLGPLGLPIIEPDYTKPAGAIFHEVAWRTLACTDDLLTLNIVQRGFENATEKEWTLPTWAPCWDNLSHLYLLAEASAPFCASGDSLPAMRFSEDFKVLECEGMSFDTISEVFPVLDSLVFPRSGEVKPSQGHPMLTLWQSGLGNETFNLDEKYLDSKESTFQAYCHTLSAANASAYTTSFRRRLLLENGFEELSDQLFTQGAAAFVQDLASDNAAMSGGFLEAAEKGNSVLWSRSARFVVEGRRFAITKKGYFVLAPHIAKVEDVVVILYGGKTPYLLRSETEDYTLVGECYAHGLMKGEAMDMLARGELLRQKFKIR